VTAEYGEAAHQAWPGRRQPGAARKGRVTSLRRRRRALRMARDGEARASLTGQPSMLRDGSLVLIRQVRGTDVALLADCFDRLSEQSRRSRFLGNKARLSSAELRFLTRVDHHDHEALAALDRRGRGAGVARYVRDHEDRGAAEIAVTIVDEWQGRGLGSKLLELLSDRARAAGIVRFTATVALGNLASERLIRTAGGVLAGQAPGSREYEISLVPWQEPFLVEWLGELDAGLAPARPDPRD
jgi:RimJ/RimL family protein N-acetyltransferase